MCLAIKKVPPEFVAFIVTVRADLARLRLVDDSVLSQICQRKGLDCKQPSKMIWKAGLGKGWPQHCNQPGTPRKGNQQVVRTKVAEDMRQDDQLK